MYTVGLMREGLGSENNFRTLAGQLPESLQILEIPRNMLSQEQPPKYRKAIKDFQPYTIRSVAMDGYAQGEWQHYQVMVDRNLIRVWADGKLLNEVIEKKPLLKGRMGFRNFAPGTAIQIRNLRAIRPGD